MHYFHSDVMVGAVEVRLLDIKCTAGAVPDQRGHMPVSLSLSLHLHTFFQCGRQTD